jgi:hypothetical protein
MRNAPEAGARGRSLTHASEVRNQVAGSAYVVRLVSNVQTAPRPHRALDKLTFLLYPSNLTDNDEAQIRRHGDEGGPHPPSMRFPGSRWRPRFAGR